MAEGLLKIQLKKISLLIHNIPLDTRAILLILLFFKKPAVTPSRIILFFPLTCAEELFRCTGFIKIRSAINVKKYTYSAKKSDNEGKWGLVDANGAILGRLATIVASRLQGKHNPLYTPHVDTGDWMVVINADKIQLTGKKLDQKRYYRHSGYIGGLTETTAKELKEKRPEDLIRFAVKGMLPKNKLGRKLFNKLKVYAGNQHPHEAQNPEVIEL
jgi:large subunit ribosomal protein L13